ncbi:hypothetical protein FKM82_011362 [Ascaphus truei]
MWQRFVLSTVLRLWLVISCSSGQSGDEELADLGSGFIIDTLRDQPKEPHSNPQDTNQCHLTFVTSLQQSCREQDTPPVLKEDVAYLQSLLQDSNRILQSLKYTVNADAQELGYQEVISEHNKGIQEDNKEFYGILNKVMQELNTQIEEDSPEEKKKLRKTFRMMDHLLQTTSRLAENLDKASHDLDVVIAKQLHKSTTLAYRNIMKS